MKIEKLSSYDHSVTYWITTKRVKWSDIPDGLHFISPIGNGEKRGSLFYTMTGRVIEVDSEVEFSPSRAAGDTEHCAKWSAKKRASVVKLLAEQAAIQKERKRKEAEAWQEKHDKLLGAAKAKLTEDELQAVIDEYSS